VTRRPQTIHLEPNQDLRYKSKSTEKVKILLHKSMNVLLTNDDGVYAEGLWALFQSFAATHQVTVVAPDRERSAIGHAITLHQPLRAAKISLNGAKTVYAVNGTPADCVKLGVAEIMPTRPDLVVAGINPGANCGANLNYSGTVAAAKEAALCGALGIAVSIAGPRTGNYSDVALFVLQLGEKVFRKGLPFGTFLNVNMPDLPLKEIAGVRVSRQGVMELSEYVEKRTDPRNRTYYWQGRDTQSFEQDPLIDGTALDQKFISITPVKCDMTDYGVLENMAGWDFDEWIERFRD
jgi:5'-nucleotidase